MKRYIYYFIITASVFIACKEKKYEPLSKSDAIPQKVTNLEVENLPGAAKISYTLPDDPDLLYVQGEYNTKDGETRIAKSSMYKNYLLVEGFGDTDEYPIEIVAVNRSENKSEKVIATVKPLRPPLTDFYNSLDIKEGFSSISLNYFNEVEEEYIINSYVVDEAGEWTPLDRLYTKSKERSYSIFGLESAETQFAFYITDRWKNYSDTLFQKLTPLAEMELDKSLWELVDLPNDYNLPEYGYAPIENIWDNRYGYGDTGWYIAKTSNTPMPHSFTIDLGITKKLSRLKVYQLQLEAQNLFFTSYNIKRFEVWGSNDPNMDGSWENWTLLIEGKSEKPSGLPIGQLSAEDIEYAKEGENYVFPSDAGQYRYIRFKCFESWAGGQKGMFAEVTVFGEDDK